MHLTLCVHVHREVLEDVHVCRVGDGAHGGRAALAVDMGNSLCAYIQHQSVDQLDVVTVSRLIGHLMQTRILLRHCFFFYEQPKICSTPRINEYRQQGLR